MARLLCGKRVAEALIERIRQKSDEVLRPLQCVPRLDIIKANEREDSRLYVSKKIKLMQRVLGSRRLGFEAHLHNFAPTDAAGLKQKIQDLNGDDRCHGIIIQSPVEVNPPTSLAELTLLVNPQKDVDGLHPMNMGRISARSGRPWFFPCTPLGIVLLCKYYGIPFAGRRVAILGRSEIVGLPMSLLLTRLNATVTLCHQYSLDIPTITRECDIVIVATGQPSLVQADWIKPGSAVIDVGINRISGGGKPIIVGDVSPSCRAVAGSLSPVPGGVGPMTVATLVYNVLNAALRRHGVAPLDELIT